MKSLFKFSLVLSAALVILAACNKDEEDIPPPVDETSETGILTLNLALFIEESDARLKEVNTDDFVVKIFRVVDGQPDELVEEYPRFADMPEEIELITGTYYVEAQNIDPPLAAEFEQPWYYGVSENFNIDKEDLVAITVDCSLANYKVAFVYTQNVLDNFTTWHATAERVVSGESLLWAQGDDREGFFLTGEDLSIVVHLEYQKAFEPGVITRDFYATIDDPNPATLYRVTIDAVLQDGIITIGIDVDDGFTIVDINPVSAVTFSGPGDVNEIEGGATVEEDPANPQQGFGRDMVTWYLSDVWLADHKTVFWGPSPDMIKASMDGGVFEDGDPNEILDYDPSSNRAGGELIFNGTTKIPHHDGSIHDVELRFELTVTDKNSGTPRSLEDPAVYGLPASIGGLVELTSISDEVQVDFVILARDAGTVTYYNFLQYYDAAPTPPGPLPADGGGDAYTSFTGGFYWSNQ